MVEIQKYGVVFDLFYNAVEGMTVGQAKHVIVAPADGYGAKDLTAFHEVPKNKVPEDIKVGTQLNGKDASGHVVRPSLDAANNLVRALRVCQRVFSHVGVDHLVVVQLEGVLQRNHFAL